MTATRTMATTWTVTSSTGMHKHRNRIYYSEVFMVPSHWQFDDVFDALELGCGQLLLDLNLFIRRFDSGSRILLATRDVGSKVEIPAWCRLTGNCLVEAAHPYYLIERKPIDQ